MAGLRELCRRRGVCRSGNKSELAGRLVESTRREAPGAAELQRKERRSHIAEEDHSWEGIRFPQARAREPQRRDRAGITGGLRLWDGGQDHVAAPWMAY